jgi:hypothetical protein
MIGARATRTLGAKNPTSEVHRARWRVRVPSRVAKHVGHR